MKIHPKLRHFIDDSRLDVRKDLDLDSRNNLNASLMPKKLIDITDHRDHPYEMVAYGHARA